MQDATKLTPEERRVVAEFLFREARFCQRNAEQMRGLTSEYTVQDITMSEGRANLFKGAALELLAAVNKG